MLYESTTLPRHRLADRKWADEAGQETGAGEKLLAVLLSLGIAGVVTIAMPLALLHVR